MVSWSLLSDTIYHNQRFDVLIQYRFLIILSLKYYDIYQIKYWKRQR